MLLLTFIFYIAFASWTILMGILSIPFLILPSKFIRFPAKMWIKGLFILLKYICGLTHEIRGLNKLSNEPIIIVSKHQSAFETFALYYYLEKSFFIHKKQLFYIPIFGQYLMKHNMVAINRSGKASAMRKMISDVKKKLDSGSTIIIFPEGTRKQPGEKADYKTGFIGIYNVSKRKLQPVALNSGLYWQKGIKIIKKGHIIIEFLPQIEAGLNKTDVLEKVKYSIESATKKLLS